MSVIVEVIVGREEDGGGVWSQGLRLEEMLRNSWPSCELAVRLDEIDGARWKIRNFAL